MTHARLRVQRAAVTVGSLLLVLATAWLPRASALAPQPLDHQRANGDPSVAATPQGLVMLVTGQLAPRAVSPNGVSWSWGGPALATTPDWAVAGDMTIWAADIAEVDGTWLLYYSARVDGPDPGSRCIGVATSDSANGVFEPQGDEPLVCTAATGVAAEDVVPLDWTITVHDTMRPSNGVIDPSFFTYNGQNFLLYKTQGKPATIRIVPLSADGLHVLAGTASRELLRTQRVSENPVLIVRDDRLYLFTSWGDFGSCGYATMWRSSKTIVGLANAKQQPLLSKDSSRLCGPGGADIIPQGGSYRAYFEAWMCWGGQMACTNPRDQSQHPLRALYGARVTFVNDKPQVSGYLRPLATG